MILHLLDADRAELCRDDVLAVWNKAFGPVTDEPDWVSTVWDRHRGRSDYRLAIAGVDDVVVGFAWGYTGAHGQYWPDLVSRTLGPAAAEWVGGHFEFVELAVDPEARGRGVGRALHDRLLDGVPHERALLGTSADPADPAVRLYRSRGWRRLGLLSAQVQVMGLRGPGRRPR